MWRHTRPGRGTVHSLFWELLGGEGLRAFGCEGARNGHLCPKARAGRRRDVVGSWAVRAARCYSSVCSLLLQPPEPVA